MREFIEKIFKKFTDFFGGIWQAGCLVLALLLVWYLAGISIKYTLPFIVMLWAFSEFTGGPKARKTLARILKIIVLLVLINSILTAGFPRIKQKEIVLRATIEQVITPKMGDHNTVNLKDLAEMKRLEQGKKLKLYCAKLFDEGKPQEAYDTLRKFNEAWDMKIKIEKPNPDPVFFSETATLQKGDQWFTDNRFKVGDRYKLVIEGAAVKYYASDGSKIIQPGVYPNQLVNSPKGALAFEGINKRTKVTVTYSR